jgi:hypothetical protein
MISTPGVSLIKLYGCNFTHSFCKLDHFITVNNIYYCIVKKYSLQKTVFTPEKNHFCKLDCFRATEINDYYYETSQLTKIVKKMYSKFMVFIATVL